jgi:DNA-binding IclR family transcriptional regulator
MMATVASLPTRLTCWRLVVYRAGMTFAELARALEAPKSSVHGFISGLLANGWRSNIRRPVLATAGGKALLAERSEAEREAFLRRRGPDEADLVEAFLADYEDIKRTGIATNVRLRGTRYALAATVRSQSGAAVASVTLVGRTADVQPRLKKLSRLLLQHVESWSQRLVTPREAI